MCKTGEKLEMVRERFNSLLWVEVFLASFFLRWSHIKNENFWDISLYQGNSFELSFYERKCLIIIPNNMVCMEDMIGNTSIFHWILSGTVLKMSKK